MEIKMKKILLLASMLVLVMALTACGKEESGEKEGSKDDKKSIEGTVTDIAKKIVDDGKFIDEVVTIDNEMINQKLDIDSANVEESVCYYGTGDSANIVYVAIFKEESKAKDAKEKLEVYLDELKTANESYDPEELGKIDDAILEIDGQYAIMVISDDDEGAKKAIDSFRK